MKLVDPGPGLYLAPEMVIAFEDIGIFLAL